MNRKLIGTLFIMIFTCSSVYMVASTFSVEQNVIESETSSNNMEYKEIEAKNSGFFSSWDFYDEIGDIYSTRTSDRVTIKLLRYHAPGKDFNYGSQPILLFPGLMENINQYLVYTTPDIEKYFDPTLPDEIAEWAQGDENIEEDPLLYYSLAYYLWKHGYDTWFANYRGVGYGSMKSSGGNSDTTLDDFAIYDVRAAVRKVYDVTNQHPYIGGHSTGGLTSIVYLQGCKYSWTGEVYSDSSAVAERNGDKQGPETVKGFIGLEPAWIPSITSDLDNILVWAILNTGIPIDIRSLSELLLDLMEMPLIGDLIELFIQLILDAIDDDIDDIMLNLLNLDSTNIDAIWLYYAMAYVLDTLYLRVMAQYADYSTYDTVREYWQNGWFNSHLIRPPAPSRRDGYYYYKDNVEKCKVPAIFFFASHQNNDFDLVDRERAKRDIIGGNSNWEDSEFYIIDGAHLDFLCGLRAPVDLYPKLGQWLATA